MKYLVTFEVVNTTGACDDFGNTHASVIASSKKEAWNKMLALEDRENVIRIWNVKAL